MIITTILVSIFPIFVKYQVLHLVQKCLKINLRYLIFFKLLKKTLKQKVAQFILSLCEQMNLESDPNI